MNKSGSHWLGWGEVGEPVELVGNRRIRPHQPGQAADFLDRRLLDRDISRVNRAEHRDRILEEIGPDHPFQTAIAA
jgi:hypothetical protein